MRKIHRTPEELVSHAKTCGRNSRGSSAAASKRARRWADRARALFDDTVAERVSDAYLDGWADGYADQWAEDWAARRCFDVRVSPAR